MTGSGQGGARHRPAGLAERPPSHAQASGGASGAAISRPPRATIAPHKQKPYFPEKDVAQGLHELCLNDVVELANGEADHYGQTAPVCLHLALEYLKWQGSKREFLQSVETPGLIQEHFAGKLDRIAQQDAFIWHRADAHKQLVAGRQFGHHLQAVADKLLEIEPNSPYDRPSADLLFAAPNSQGAHALAANVQIKRDRDGSKRICVSFYDPNVTATHRRLEVDAYDPAKPLTGFGIHDFLTEEHYQNSLDGADDVYLAAVCQDLTFDADATTVTMPDHQLLHPRNVRAACMGGMRLAMEQIRDAVVRAMPDRPADDLADAFDEKDETGASGLSYLLQSNFPGALQPFVEAVASLDVTPDRQFALLSASMNGEPVLHQVFAAGQADTAVAFVHSLATPGLRLSAQQRIDLLMARNDSGVAALTQAMVRGDADTVKRFAQAIHASGMPFTAEQKLELMLAPNSLSGRSGLRYALQNGQAEVIDAWREAAAELNLDPFQILLRVRECLEGIQFPDQGTEDALDRLVREQIDRQLNRTTADVSLQG